ncbi:MAG: hypothetical protein ACHQPI_03995 [Thermoanaerobaculia bacterium]
MDPRKDPVELVTTAACKKCGEIVPEKQLRRCPWCFRDFCFNCRFARGAADYCSRGCAEAMFHGGDEEDGAPEE